MNKTARVVVIIVDVSICILYHYQSEIKFNITCVNKIMHKRQTIVSEYPDPKFIKIKIPNCLTDP